MREIVLFAANGTRVLVEESALTPIQKFRQIKPSDKEAGGILIGEYRGNDLRIVSVTLPGEKDFRSRYRFGRRSPHHQARAYESWLRSKHTQSHIGDWHTHPQDYPSPSALDYKEWREKLPQRHVLLIILGRKADWYGIWDGSEFVEILSF
ncbi:TPA: Mov34/MPN/PAD-1 family protein [Vibrio parahaemolyticus]|uniref:Mov34/MPN/PAD-1 family protein n=1 Tax=Vibrio alginolyticus TaxID=663 RepID=UPI003755001E